MPSTLHETLVSIFKHRPTLAAELLADALGLKVPHFRNARMATSTFADLAPAEHRADAVVVLEADVPALGIVVEVQLRIDWRKRLKWPLYAVGFRAKLGCPTCVLVVTPSARVAAWASQPIELGPGNTFTPLVLGPAQMPRLTDAARIAAHPDLAVLSAITHGKTFTTAEARVVDRTVMCTADPECVMLYSDVIFNALSAAVRRRFRAMDITKYRFTSPFSRFVAAKIRKAQAKAGAEGIAEGRAEAILGVLAARRIPVATQIRQRVLSCRDVKLLDRWVRRAAVVARADEMIRRPRAGKPTRAKPRAAGTGARRSRA